MKSFKTYIEESAKGVGFGCIMLMFDGSLEKGILDLTKKINPDHLYKPEDGYGVETEPHVTVKYGLHEKSHSVVLDEMKKFSPVSIKLKTKISLFNTGPHYDVIKIGITSPELREMNKFVCDNFDYTDSFPTYNPHTTIAYVWAGYGERYLKLESPLFGTTYTVDKLCYSDANSSKQYITLK